MIQLRKGIKILLQINRVLSSLNVLHGSEKVSMSDSFKISIFEHIYSKKYIFVSPID